MTDSDQRKAWSRPYIQRAPDAPMFGSPEWLALPDGPEKIAAVVKAAECWVTELEDQMEAMRALAKHAEDAAWVRHKAEHRRQWTGRGFRPDRAAAADVEREWREWVA